MSKSRAKAADTVTAAAGSDPKPLTTVGDALNDQLVAQLSAALGISPEPEPEPEVKNEDGAAGVAEAESPEPETEEVADAAEPAAEPGVEVEAEGESADTVEQTTEEVPDLLQQADAQTADKEAEEDGESGEGRVPLKRLHKEVARRKALEAQLAELQARGKANPPPVNDHAPFVEQLPEVVEARTAEKAASKQLGEVKGMLRELARNPEAVRERLQKEYGIHTAGLEDDQVQAQLEAARDQFSDQHTEAVARRATVVEKRSEQIKAHQSATDLKALELYPWMKQPDSEEWKTAQAIMAQAPQLMSRPDRGILLGRLVTGSLLERGRTAPVKAPKVARKVPPNIPAPKAAPRSAGVAQAGDKSVHLARAAAAGDREAMVEALAGVL